MFTHAKKDQARIIGQIQKSYTNSSELTTPLINQVEFERAIKKDNISFYFEDVVKSFASDTMKEIEKAENEEDKKNIISKSAQELSCLSKIDIVFDNIIKSIYVDVIDSSTNTFKDNEINRLLDRVGKSSK